MPPFAKPLLLLLAVLLGFFASDIYRWLTAPPQTIVLDDYCQVSKQGCKSGEVIVKLSGEHAQPLVPTTLNVEWPNANSETLILTLQGYEMDMGTVKFKIDKLNDNQYQTDIILPVCRMETMTWVGELTDGTTTINTLIRMAR
ncbi:hypothetical protein DZ860_14850 [Vibrio sinensis]|uniref:Uncharacterized protein n=2 Tax=Vibrio sinensis TaxID=2302434 RepID=A0A3A6QMV0_9VIBR|nr:hypothetical protein DZ860_14850 [Vibrio sinensis]